MPTYGYAPDWRQIEKDRRALEASLVAKGLVPGTSKFMKVFYRKWRRHGCS